MSAIIDPLDRTTAVLFGDGAGAVLLEPAEPGFGLLDFYHRVDGSGRDDLLMPAGGSLHPASHATVDAREHFLKQNGKVVFKFAVSQMADCITTILERHQLTPDDIAMVIPHQANQRILDATAERLGLPPGRMASVIARYGNTTAATLPLALEDVVRDGPDQPGRPGDLRGGRRGLHGGGEPAAVAIAGRPARTRRRRSPRRSSASASDQVRRADAVERVLDRARARDHDDRGRLRQHPGQHHRVGRDAEPPRRSAPAPGWHGSVCG